MRKIIKDIYGSIRSVAPYKINGILGKLAFFLGGKPIVKYDKTDSDKKFPNLEKGGLIISADFEMAWAWRYTKTGSNHVKKGKMERENIPKIIEVLERFNIPITFATVGHLFLKNCNKGDHDWMKRIPHFDDHWKFTDGDWFDHDPYSDYKSTPEWYAPDLIRMIVESNVEHEIGTHTFSHIDFSYENCPPEVAEDEIEACIKVAEPFDMNIKSMVFPGGTWGHIEVLKKYNFAIYRKKNDFELAYPYRDEQNLLVATSSGSLEYNLNYGWSPEYYVNRLKKYLEKAIASNTIAQFWFHPSLNPFILEKIFPPILSYAAKLREEGLLWIGPMKKIADHINKNKVL